MEDKKLIESLSPNERKVLPHINEKEIVEICKKTNLDKISVARSLEYLQNKGIIVLNSEKKKTVELGLNGALYKKRGLPERMLLTALSKNMILSLEEAQKKSELSDEEFKASIGALKKKAMIDLKNGKIVLSSTKEEIAKKMLEESLLEILPTDYESLTPEQMYALKSLQNRKEIIEIVEEKKTKIEVTELGKKLQHAKLGNEELIEQITSDLLKKESSWKNKKFRRYDVSSPVPSINGGKRHFVNQAIDYGRKIWIELGFEEMEGKMVQSSFWNFDALFTAQDHPVREMQDTFFINKSFDLPEDKKMIRNVKEAHEKGVDGSKGWQYNWEEEKAKKAILRTHTTCLSSQTLSKLDIKKDLPKKFFAIGKCFRNETVDWSHGFEFNQTEGIVVDEKANFRNLLGYLKQFFKKMGYEKIRFRPSFFPYTEPSVEIDVWHPEKQIWFELGGAGIFRPEVTIPLLGKAVPVLAWGPGFDRILMNYYEIKDLRELYKNDISKLRKIKYWTKE